KDRRQKCDAIQLAYSPYNVVSYEFTDELREAAKKFAMDTAFEGFEGVIFQFSSEDDKSQDDQVDPLKHQAQLAGTNPPSIPNGSQVTGVLPNEDSLGWINTIKGKPLQLIMVQDNKMESFLYPNKP
ncbi:MAG: hypothetical protein ACFFG0_24125, partial [Candidatus Thorarchaeota archaeon]